MGDVPGAKKVAPWSPQRRLSLSDFKDLVASCTTLAELRTALSSATDVKNWIYPAKASGNKPLSWEPIEVDSRVDSDSLVAMIRHVEQTWKTLGEQEPYWSVRGGGRYKQATIEENRQEFYQSGANVIGLLEKTARRCGVDLAAYKSCFELGCGVGRASVWLSKRFRKVIAADISPSHLDLARDAAEYYQQRNIVFHKIDSLASLDDLPDFDAFLSLIVLQHNPPPVIRAFLDRILHRLQAGGIGYFQVPTYQRGYQFRAQKYLSSLGQPIQMEGHLLPQAEVFDVVERNNCHLIEVREDGLMGRPNGISNVFFIRKSTEASSMRG